MKKTFKKNLTIFLCLTMIFNFSFSIFADENIESNEPLIIDTELIDSEGIILSIEEPISVDDAIEEKLDESFEEIKEIIEEPIGEDDKDIESVYENEPETNISYIVIEEKLLENVEDYEEEIPSEVFFDDINEASQSDIEKTEKIEIEEEIEETPIEDIEKNTKKETTDTATNSEIDEVINEKCEITIYFLTDMKLKKQGNGGTYNYSFVKYLVDKGSEFNTKSIIPNVVKHSSCDQEYTLIGFTTENQIDNLWKSADYAGGDATLEKNFIVENDMEIFAVYEAKDIYISSIIIDNEITYKTTTIPNKAMKNIIVSDNEDDVYVKDENVKYYKIKNNFDDINYMFTKDASEGKPIKIDDFSFEKYKK